MIQNSKSYMETSFGLVFCHGGIAFKYQHWYIKDSSRLVWPQAILVLALYQQQGYLSLIHKGQEVHHLWWSQGNLQNTIPACKFIMDDV
jgi:hypothetical protein